MVHAGILEAGARSGKPCPIRQDQYWMTAAVAAEAATPEKGDRKFTASEKMVVCTLTTSPGRMAVVRSAGTSISSWLPSRRMKTTLSTADGKKPPASATALSAFI